MGALVSVEGAVLCGYVACLSVLFAFSMSQLHLVLLHRRDARPPARPVANGGQWPTVVVQLPIYNERYVVERLLRSVAAIDYPRDRLLVQVLDDSTDVTRTLISDLLPQLRADGLCIEQVRRPDRTGFKAGALAYGLSLTDADLVAVFDADFVPASDVLRVMVPYLQGDDVAAVQARWGYLNEGESRLTRIEAFMLDMHFGLEQPARQSAGMFLNFNGTAGIWRRTAIEDAGGWSARTLTEDIDLSYRAQLRGWRLVYLPDYVCPGELPAQMSGLRSQQYRWMKGGAQNARLHLTALGRYGLDADVRRHARAHLLAGSTYLVILAAVLLSVPLAAVKGTSIGFDYADYGIAFAASTAALVSVFHAARRPRGWSGQVRFAVDMAAFMVFTIGLSVHNGLAVLSGWSGLGGEFERTPKAGTVGWASTSYARRELDRRVVPELGVLLILVAGLAIGWWRGQYALVPLQLLASSGLGWVVTLSLWHPARAHRRAGAGLPVTTVSHETMTTAPEEARL